MLYFHYVEGKLTKVSSEYAPGALCRVDFDSISYAQDVADAACALTGQVYIATDAGPRVHPRYDVIKAPVVGDKVSRSFNGDSYPAGEIVKVSASLRRVQTSTGVVFWRDGQSARWVSDGTWSMTGGHEERRNPEI